MPKTIVYIHPAETAGLQCAQLRDYLEERGYACTDAHFLNQANESADTVPPAAPVTVIEAFELVA